MRVFVLDKNKQPLMPCSPARARKLLSDEKAAIYRRYPFTIILKEREHGATQPISLNIDPGSKTTGIALVALFKNGAKAIAGIHLEHRGYAIKEALESRRAIRRSRRQRKTRYRQARFLNRKKAKGWLPPSLMSRVYNTETWAKRLVKYAPITEAHVETVRFDMQLMENPNISGIEYQQGTLQGYEVREYLLQRHNHTCAYCDGLSKDQILNIEHIIPRAKGGTNRINNLVIACRTCNEDKGAIHPKIWMEQCGKKKSALNKKRASNMQNVLKGIRPTMRDAAAVNATRYKTGKVIKELVPNTQFFSGGRTKKNRTSQHYAKDHWIDAACIGRLGESVELEVNSLLIAKAQGHGSRQMCRMNKYGFPVTKAKGSRTVQGFKTGDIVKAIVPTGIKAGTYTGRVAVRSSGSFNIKDKELIQGISHRYCQAIQKSDGYHFTNQKIALNKEEEKRVA